MLLELAKSVLGYVLNNRLILSKRAINVTPGPPLTGLGGGDDGMIGRVEVTSSVLVFGVVAAAYVAAGLAYAQVHPIVAQGYAFGADVLFILNNLS